MVVGGEGEGRKERGFWLWFSPPRKFITIRNRKTIAMTDRHLGSSKAKPDAVQKELLPKTPFLKVAAPIVLLIFGGCCSNVYTLEVLIGSAPKSGHLITFAQFLVVSLDGLLHHLYIPARKTSSAATTPQKPSSTPHDPDNKATSMMDYVPRLRPSVIPMSRWMVLVALFFLVSILNNLALGFDISVPLHILFRSGGLFVSMVLGKLVLKKKYTSKQVVAVMMVTSGVLLATLDNSPSRAQGSESTTQHQKGSWLTGILLLSAGMVLAGLLGLAQEVTYKKYGKQWREGLFYTHFLGLPFFLLLKTEILEQLAVVNASTPILVRDALTPPSWFPLTSFFGDIGGAEDLLSSVGLWDLRVPRLWAFLLLNLFTQYFCISGVHQLTSVTTALTVNLILNVRKFTSLILSIWYFGNPFDTEMQIGTALVFAGSLLYTLRANDAPATSQSTSIGKKAASAHTTSASATKIATNPGIGSARKKSR